MTRPYSILRYLAAATTLLTCLTGCTPNSTFVPPKEGDIVTWKVTPPPSGLVIKAKLGQRRVHVPDKYCPKCESNFYNPKYDLFVGQFPIDYSPPKYSDLTLDELSSISKVPWGYPNIGFNLVLNGAKLVTPSDAKFFKGEPSFESPDQVIVEIRWDVRSPKFWGSKEANLLRRTSNPHFHPVNSELAPSLDCANLDNSHSLISCLGSSSNPDTYAEILVFQSYIEGSYSTRSLGDLSVRYLTNRKNLKDWKLIDEAIWRLISTWNVTPH